MADTRKDKRAPVSLKVRFKSATVDEFIEHYSKDVSRGGIYIKSSNPMAVGTLLKFQFQLKDESALIKGVGRVVWTRAEVDATTDSPAGMGIKFIKMDGDSRVMVERIVEANDPDPGSYVSGRVSATSAEPTSSAPPPSSGGGNFFPDLPPAELPPPEDRTAVRQATQFLANALKEGNDEAAAAEAAQKAEEASKRQEEVEAQRKVEAAKVQPVEERAPLPAKDAPTAKEPKFPLPSMIIDPTLEPRTGRPSEVAREVDATPLPRLNPAATEPNDEDGEPDTEPPPPAVADERAPTTPVPTTAKAPSRALPLITIAAVVAIAAWVALRGGPQETPEPAAEPIAAEPAQPAKIEPAPSAVEPTTESEPAGAEKVPAVEDKPIGGAEVALVAVDVAATPREAEIFVGGVKKGEGALSLDLPAGSASTVSARAKGYLEATQTVTPVVGKKLAPIRFKLKPLPFVVHVESTPAGAAVNVGGVKGVTPVDLALDKPPTEELSVTAKLDGYERALTRIGPDSFNQTDDAMRAQLSLTLTAKLPVETSKEATPPPPVRKRPLKRSTPKADVPSEKPVEGATEPAKAEEPSAEPPPPAEVAPEPPKEEPKPAEPLPSNPFGT